MRNYGRDSGIVFKKRTLLKENQVITIFTKDAGKIGLFGYGIRTITSKRLSHLETGNFINFSYTKRDSYYHIGETELVWGFSKIRICESKLGLMYTLFFILDKLMPEGQPEPVIFEKTLTILTKLNSRPDFHFSHLKEYICEVLTITGFIDEEKRENALFDPFLFVETLIDRKISWAFATK